MLVDEQEAPLIEGVADVNGSLKQRKRTESTDDTPIDPVQKDQTGPPESAPDDTPQEPRVPCVPAVPREGCLTQNGSANDAQVARLEAQMVMLQRAVAQLVEVQTNANTAAAQQQRQQGVPAMPAAAPAPAAVPVRPVARPRQPEQPVEQDADEQPVEVQQEIARPVRQIAAGEGEVRLSAEARLLRQQAAQIEQLQQQLDELKRAQAAAAKAPVTEPNPGAPADRATPAVTAGRAKLTSEPQPKKSMNPFKGMLGSLGKGR